MPFVRNGHRQLTLRMHHANAKTFRFCRVGLWLNMSMSFTNALLSACIFFSEIRNPNSEITAPYDSDNPALSPQSSSLITQSSVLLSEITLSNKSSLTAPPTTRA
jgi:hypothetical protein